MTQLEQDYELIGQIIARMILRNGEQSLDTGRTRHEGATLMFCVPLANKLYKDQFGEDMFDDYFKQEKPNHNIESMKTKALIQGYVDPMQMKGYHKHVGKLYQPERGMDRTYYIDVATKRTTLNSLNLLTDNMCKAIDLAYLKYGHIGTWGWFAPFREIISKGEFVETDNFWNNCKDMNAKEYKVFYNKVNKFKNDWHAQFDRFVR